jgi:hypothetical protein
LGLFRRREPLHLKLAREGGLELGDGASRPAGNPAAPGPEPGRAPWDASGIHGVHRVREWAVVTTARAPELQGERVEFVAIAPEELVCEGGDGDLSPLTAAVERDLVRPYRGEAVRREGELWAVAARPIEVVRLPGLDGQEIELSSHAGERSLVVDGEEQFGSVPSLERPEHVVRARRIAGDAWEVEIDPL